MRQDSYFSSPEQNTTQNSQNSQNPQTGQYPSAASDIWSLGVTFVMMSTGHTINYKDNYKHVGRLIADNKIFIDDVPLDAYLTKLNDLDYRKRIISRTLCLSDKQRVSAKELLILCQSLRDAPNIGIGHEYGYV